MQRTRLAKYDKQYQRFRGIFSEIRHDKENKPEILLLDIYPIYSNGKKVPLRSKPALFGQKGQQIAADHVWTKLNKNFLLLPEEALFGDVIDFSALVVKYPIVRENVVNERESIWKHGKNACQQVYKKYLNYKNTTLEIEYQAMQKANEKAYEAYKKHLLTFKEMTKAQKQAKRAFQKAKRKAYRSMKAKQKRRINHAKKDIANVDMVDYGLKNINHCSFFKLSRKVNKYRDRYNASRLQDISYTKYLAAHSMNVRQLITKGRDK